MTTETQQPQANTPEHKQPIPFGLRLKSAREALGLERKDAAQKLRLSEKIILMMEKDRYPIDLPVTFIRGYLRAYGKLLQIPEYEVKKAIEPIKQKAHQSAHAPVIKNLEPVANHYFMHIFTLIIVITMVALVGMWWYSHSTMLSQQAVPALEAGGTQSAENINPIATPLASDTKKQSTTEGANSIPSSARRDKLASPPQQEETKKTPIPPAKSTDSDAKYTDNVIDSVYSDNDIAD